LLGVAHRIWDRGSKIWRRFDRVASAAVEGLRKVDNRDDAVVVGKGLAALEEACVAFASVAAVICDPIAGASAMDREKALLEEARATRQLAGITAMLQLVSYWDTAAI
jgi:hypothetical protein